MPAPTQSSQYTKESLIPPSAWGKDHWSTLAYAETVMMESAGFQVGNDPRMRQGRRHFRIMKEQCASPKRPTRAAEGVVMEDRHGSRLADGTYVPGHDDWHCIQDMAAAGFFTVGQEGVEPGVTLHLSELGAGVSNALRAHKRSGGTFSDFKPTPELLGQPKPEGSPTPPAIMQPGDIKDIDTLSVFLAERPALASPSELAEMVIGLEALSNLRMLSSAARQLGAVGFSADVDEETCDDDYPLVDVTMHFEGGATLSSKSSNAEVQALTGREEGLAEAARRTGLSDWSIAMRPDDADALVELFGDSGAPLPASLGDNDLANLVFGKRPSPAPRSGVSSARKPTPGRP